MIRELRIIVAGSRGFYDYQLLSDTLMDYLAEMDDKDVVDNPSQVKFISGTCRGADVLGEQFAYTYEYDVIRFSVECDLYGKAADYKQSEEIVKFASEAYGVLIAFWDGQSKGTKHMIDLANKYGLEVHVVNYKENNTNAEITE